MLLGEYRHNLDSKGRLIMPSKFREDIGDDFIITKGLDSCLFIYPKLEWGIIEDKLKKLPLTNKEARSFIRFFFSGASECSLDKQGRMLIPQNLREYSRLEKESVIIGVSNRIELWSKDQWDLYNEEELNYDSISEKMEELGI